MTLPTAIQTPFQFPIRIYWEDTDAGGIVFYANYLKFFERARTEWLRALGIEQHALKTEVGGMFVVSETSLKYHRPAQLDDLLTVTAELAQAGRASLTLRQQAWREQTGQAAQLLAEDVAQHFDALQRYAEPELRGDEWAPADFPGYE